MVTLMSWVSSDDVFSFLEVAKERRRTVSLAKKRILLGKMTLFAAFPDSRCQKKREQ